MRSPSASSQSKSFLEGTPQAGLTSLFGITPVTRGRVWFNSPLNSAVDITPYSRIYGVHPRFFDFDAVGDMQLTPAAAKACRAWKGSIATTGAGGGSPQASDTPRNKVVGNTAASEQVDIEGVGWPTCSRRATMNAAVESRPIRSLSPPPYSLEGNCSPPPPAAGPLGSSCPASGHAPAGTAVSSPPAGSTTSCLQPGYDGSIEGSGGDLFFASTAVSPRALSPPSGRAERGGGTGRGSCSRPRERLPRQNFSLAAHSRAQLGGEGTALLVDRAASSASPLAFHGRRGEAPGNIRAANTTGSQKRSLSASCAERSTSLLKEARAASLLGGAMKELSGSSSVSQLDLLKALNRALDSAVGASAGCQATGPTCGVALTTVDSVGQIAPLRPAVGQTCSTAWSTEAAPIRHASGQPCGTDQIHLSARRPTTKTTGAPHEPLRGPMPEARVPLKRDRVLTAALPEVPAMQMATGRQPGGSTLLVAPPRRTLSGMPQQVRVSRPPPSLQAGNGAACVQSGKSGACSPLLPTNLAQVPVRSSCTSIKGGTNSPPAPQPMLRSRRGGA